MAAKLDPFAAAPLLMKEWQRTSLAVASSLEPSLIELVKIRAPLKPSQPSVREALTAKGSGGWL